MLAGVRRIRSKYLIIDLQGRIAAALEEALLRTCAPSAQDILQVDQCAVAYSAFSVDRLNLAEGAIILGGGSGKIDYSVDRTSLVFLCPEATSGQRFFPPSRVDAATIGSSLIGSFHKRVIMVSDDQITRRRAVHGGYLLGVSLDEAVRRIPRELADWTK